MKDNWVLPIIELELCTQCSVCIDQCPEHAISMDISGPSFVHPEKCTFCAICEEICLEGAIRCELEIVWEDTIG